MVFAPTKLYYKIGEVCKIVGVEAYVLRYWETEFAALPRPRARPVSVPIVPRTSNCCCRSGSCSMSEGFTIAGARKQLGTGIAATPEDPCRQGKAENRAREPHADAIRRALEPGPDELENILTLLDRE